MHISEDDAHIDKSTWLNEGEEIITPERKAKGDMRVEYDEDGEMKFAQAQVRNILNFFHINSIIDDQQHHDALTFQVWRDIHKAAMGFTKSVSSGNEESVGVRLRAYGYILLLKRLSQYHQKAIDQALDTASTEHTQFFALRHKKTYQQAFVRLSQIIEPIREQISYLESLSDDERNTLSEESLKNLLAQIKENA